MSHKKDFFFQTFLSPPKKDFFLPSKWSLSFFWHEFTYYRLFRYTFKTIFISQKSRILTIFFFTFLCHKKNFFSAKWNFSLIFLWFSLNFHIILTLYLKTDYNHLWLILKFNNLESFNLARNLYNFFSSQFHFFYTQGISYKNCFFSTNFTMRCGFFLGSGWMSMKWNFQYDTQKKIYRGEEFPF